MNLQKSAGGVLLPSTAVKYNRCLQGEVFFRHNPQIEFVHDFSGTVLGNDLKYPGSA